MLCDKMRLAHTAHIWNRATHGEWWDDVRMPIPVAPECLLLCNRVALRLLNFDQVKTEHERKQATQKRGIFFWKYHQENCDTSTHCVHVAEHWGFYSCDAFSMSECMSKCIRSLHAQTRTHTLFQAVENEIKFVYEYQQQKQQRRWLRRRW